MKKGFHVFLFILFAVLMSPSAWAYDLSSNGEAVTLPCTDPKTVSVNKYNPVTSFVIYDDGGSGNNYSNNCGGYLTIDGLEGYGFKVSGWVMAETYDTLRILNGSSISWFPQLIADIRGTGVNSKKEFGPFYTTDNHMVVSLRTDGSVVGPGVMMNVELVPLRKAKASGMVWFDNPYDWFGASEGESRTYSEGMTVPFVLNPNYKEDELWGLNVRRLDGGGLVEFKKNADTGLYEFVMPASDVYVDVKTESSKNGFDLFNGERSLFLGGTKTLKVYDNGGPDYPYSNNFDGWLSLSTPSGFHFKVTGTVETEPSTTGTLDYLEIYEGEKSALGKLICKVYTKSESSTTKVNLPSNCVSSNEYMTIHFRSDVSITASGLDLTVSSVGNVYSVKVLNTDPNGRITSDVSSAETRSTVTVTATPNSGYVFKGVDIVNKKTGSSVSSYGNAIKENKVTFTMPASDVEVTPVFVKDTYSITKKPATGGSVTGVSSAKVGATVTMTVNTTSGYLYKGSSVSGSTISGENGFLTKTFTFTMPVSDVTVTPSFTNDWTVEGGLYVNMPTTGKITATLPAGVQSFKVYDDGGKSGYYSRNSSGTLVLTAPSGYYLQLSGNVDLYSQDYLTVCDGTDTTKTKLVDKLSGFSKDIGVVYSSGQSLTLYFNSDDYGGYSSGLDLTVNVMSFERQITYTNTNDGGSVVSSSPTKANYGSTVNYTYDYTSGYLVSDIKVVGENNYVVKASGGWYTNKMVSFEMPPSNVTVKSTYTNDLTADGGLYINMPKTGTVTATIPAGVQSFKVYDDGGKNGNYSNNSSGTLVLTAPSGYYLQLSGSVNSYDLSDYLTVCNGTDTTKTKLVDKLYGSKDLGFVYSGSRSMTLYFHSDVSGNKSGLDLTVSVRHFENQITYENTNDGGSVSSSAPKKVYYGSMVSYTYDYASGYLVSDIKVVGENNYVVKASGGWYNNKMASFKMPPVNVTVKSTYTNDLSAEGGLYIDMPTTGTVYATIPDGVKSFKVYDDGGKSGKYSKNGNGILVLTAPTGYFFEMSGMISTAETERSDIDYTYSCANDYLNVYEGSTTASTALLMNKTGCTASSGSYLPVSLETVSNGNVITLNFKSDGTDNAASGLNLTVKLRKRTVELADDGNGNKYVNMLPNHRATLNIPSGVKTFKVYDDGGVDSDYLKGFNDTLVLSAPSGYALELTGTIKTGFESQAFFAPQDYTCNDKDNLSVYDGASLSAPALLLNKTGDCTTSNGPALTSLDRIFSRSNTMTLYFKSIEKGESSTGLNLTVKLHKLVLDLADDGDGNKYVNMVPSHRATLAVPEGVTTFKVYDDGGKDGAYMEGVNDTLVLTAPAGHVLQVTGTIMAGGYLGYSFSTGFKFVCNSSGNLSVYDGYGTTAPALLLEKNSECSSSGLTKTTLPKLISNGQSLTLVTKSEGIAGYSDGLDLTVTVHKLAMDLADDGNGNKYVNMIPRHNASLDIPADVTTFKVYDDGGKNGSYMKGGNDTLVLTAPAGHLLELTGTIKTGYTSYSYSSYQWQYLCNSGDNLSVYDGINSSATALVSEKSSVCTTSNGPEETSVSQLLSSGRSLMLVFKSNADGVSSSGLNLTVKVVDFAIAIDGVAGGSLTSNKSRAAGGDSITLTASPSNNYMLKEISVKDSRNNVIPTIKNSFVDAKFVMPLSDVTVKPSWTSKFTAAGGLYLDFARNKKVEVDIPRGVTSFKVYDNGGKSGNYEASSEDILTLKAPQGYRLKLTGSVIMESGFEYLYVYDGNGTNAQILLTTSGTANKDNKTSSKNIGSVTSSDQYMTLRFKSDYSNQYAGLDLTVSLEQILYTITVNQNSEAQLDAKEKDTLGAEVYLTGSDLLSDVSVVNKNNKSVKVSVYTFDRALFTMPASDVTVTPTWATDFTAEGGLHIDMRRNMNWALDIPSKVKSFNLYDHGGKDGKYEINSHDTLTITAPDNYRLVVTGSVTLDNGFDSLYILDGKSISDAKLLGAACTSNGVAYSIPTITSSGRSLTFYFKSDYWKTSDGLNLKVSVEPVLNTIAVVNRDDSHGAMVSDKDIATPGEIVTLTATPDDGYLFDGVEIKDADGQTIKLVSSLDPDGKPVSYMANVYWYSDSKTNTFKFVMPANAVTVTPNFSAVNDLYVNMPKTGMIDVYIPENVTSFKVYDDGGKDGNYSHNVQGKLNITVSNGTEWGGMKVSGSVAAREGDKLSIFAHVLFVGKEFYTYEGTADGEPVDIGTYSNTALLRIDFESGETDNAAGLDLNVELIKPASVGSSVTVVYDDAHFWTESEKVHKLAMVIDNTNKVPLNIFEDVDVDSINFNREFKTGVYSTIVFPADFKADSLTGVQKVLRFNGFKQLEDESWAVRMKRVWTTDSIGRDIEISANSPYLVVMDDATLGIRGGVTLKKTVEPIAMAENCNWKFIGTLAYHEWPDGDPLVYGFKDNQFVKAGSNVSVKPLRAYLLKPEPKQASGRPSLNGSAYTYEYIAPMDIPDEFDIVEDDDETGENTTVIGRYNTRTGEFRMLPSYDIKGRKLNGKPNVHKAYYGKKVIRK